ncbi:MAG: PRD domain-containing protein [Cellulomonadaceae bacterium]|nr:PRD domain-containing protein [Cellulomonadaceae bacterium]
MPTSPRDDGVPSRLEEGSAVAPLFARRVLNNNAVMVVDEANAVSIVLGRAIGYGVRPGDQVDASRVSEIFLPDAMTPIEQLASFLADTPIQVVRVAREIVDVARSHIDVRVTQSLLLPIADHIGFAIERAEQGIAFEYPLRWEVTQLYPREVAVGRLGVEIVHRRLGVLLPSEEAIPLAMHLVNAQFSSHGLNPTIDMTRRITEVISAVEVSLGVSIDRNAMSTARFVTHLRYLFARMEGKKALDDAPRGVLSAVVAAHPDAYRCAQEVGAALGEGGDVLTEDEILYLTLHLARLTRAVTPSP